MKRVSIGLISVLAAAVAGFLLYRAADGYVYENGLNLNLKFAAAIVLIVLLTAGAAIVGLRLRRNR